MPFSKVRLQEQMARYGYTLVETPILEPASLFLTKAGDEIYNRLFTFERGGKQLALRPEFTASAAQRYVQGNEPVVRWQFAGVIFEDQGQYQHFSMGAELIGLAGAGADAEIISMAAQGVKNAGGQPQVIIGHIGLMRYLLQSFGLDERTQRFLLNHRNALKKQGKAHILDLLNRYLPPVELPEVQESKAATQQMLRVLLGDGIRGTVLGGRTRDDIVNRLMNKQKRAAHRDQIVAAIDFLEAWAGIESEPKHAFEQIEMFIHDEAAREILSSWRKAIELLGAYGVENVVIKPDLERTWDYYTGIVFELKLGEKPVGAGGRYDGLTQLLGGRDSTPAVGFTYYVEPLIELLGAAENEFPTRILTLTDDSVHGVKWAQTLREMGTPVLLTSFSDQTDAARLSDDGQTLYWNNKSYSSAEMLITDLRYEQ